jgi:hypothetical protein
MTSEQLSLLSLAAALLSVLFASWSLREARAARNEGKRNKSLLRRTEVLSLMSDLSIKGFELRQAALVCCDEINMRGLATRDDIEHKIGFILEQINDYDRITKKNNEIKEGLLCNDDSDLQNLELVYTETYDYLKKWEKNLKICNEILKWFKGFDLETKEGSLLAHERVGE